MLRGILVLFLATNGPLIAQNNTAPVNSNKKDDDFSNEDDGSEKKSDFIPPSGPTVTPVTKPTTPPADTAALPQTLPEPVAAAAPLKREMHEALKQGDTASFSSLLRDATRQFPNDPELKAAADKWATVNHDRTVLPAIARLLSQSSNLFGKQWTLESDGSYIQHNSKITAGSKMFGAAQRSLAAAYADLDAGEPARAEATLTRAIRKTEDFAPLYYARAMARAESGNLAKADEDSMRAVTLSRNEPQVLSQRAQLMMQMGRAPEAIAWANKAIEGNPQDADALAVRGRALWKSKGQMARGLQDLGQAAQLDPDNYQSLYRGAVVIVRTKSATSLMNKGEVARAKTEAQTILREDPYNADAHLIVAHASQKEGQPEAAIKEATLALKSEPNFGYALIERGMAFETLGARGRALSDFKRAAEINPGQFQKFYERLLQAQVQGKPPLWQRQPAVRLASIP